MADLLRKDKTTASADKRDCPFVVQIVVPDGGFGCTPDAVNASKHYRVPAPPRTTSTRRRARILAPVLSRRKMPA